MSDREQESTRSGENVQQGPECQQGQDISNTSGRESAAMAGQAQSGNQGSQGQANPPQNVKELGQAVSQDIGQATQQAQQKADDFLSDSGEQMAQTLNNVSNCLRQTAQEMSEHEHPMFGKYVRTAAESMSKFSDSLRHKDMDFFVHRTEDLARHQPGVFLGSAFTMGFALGRFLKGKSSQGQSVRRRVETPTGVSSGPTDTEIWH